MKDELINSIYEDFMHARRNGRERGRYLIVNPYTYLELRHKVYNDVGLRYALAGDVTGQDTIFGMKIAELVGNRDDTIFFEVV